MFAESPNFMFKYARIAPIDTNFLIKNVRDFVVLFFLFSTTQMMQDKQFALVLDSIGKLLIFF